MLELVGDVCAGTVFPEAEVTTRRGEIVTAIRQDEDNPAVLASEALFGCSIADGHPYGRRDQGTVASVEAIVARRPASEFHAARFRPGGLTVVHRRRRRARARGRDAATRAFGDWAAPPAPLLVPPPAPRVAIAAAARYPDAGQGAVRRRVRLHGRSAASIPTTTRSC